MNWYVLHTKPKHEKKVEEELISIGINAYCPTKVEYRIWSDRKKKINKPVLPSMVLVQIKDEKINDVFQSRGVLKYMFWLGKRAVVRNIEIKTLKQNLKNYNIKDPKIGSKINLFNFGNETGIIDKFSKNKIWVNLEHLGYKLMLETA